MRTLYLVRHAKSSWDEPGLPDRERPLNARGKRDAPRMGRQLARAGVQPDFILSSPARRARATARRIARELRYPRKDIRIDERLYATSAEQLADVIREFEDRQTSVMLVGHNPELTEFAHRFAGDITNLATCCVAELAFEADSWRWALAAAPRRVTLYSPRR